MKTAMKKLLSLMLVAVLLVSVVPFASAVQLDNMYVAFKYVDLDGNTVSTYKGTEPQNGELTDDGVASAAQLFMPSDYDFVVVDAQNPSTDGDTITYTVTVKKHIEETYAVVIELVVEGVGTKSYNVGSVKAGEASATMSKADALVKLAGQGSEYEIITTQATAQEGSSKYVYSFAAEKKVSKVTLTVNLSTGETVTISVDPGTKITRADVQKAIEKALGNSNFDFTLSPKAPFTLNENKTVTANITKNNGGNTGSDSKNVTLTVRLKGDAAGSVKMSVAAGTELKKAEIREEIVNALGRSNFTFTLNPQAPITVKENMEVTATVTNDGNNNNDDNDVTLTIKVTGAYKGTVKMDVASGTTVTVNQMKNAIKSQLGISSNFSMDRQNSITVKQDTTIYIDTSKSSDYNKFPYDVVLNVYLDTKVGEPDKRININDLAEDGTVSLGEVKNLLTDKYYKAKNSTGIVYDGLYLAQGNWVEAWSKDYDKYDTITGMADMRNESRVDINVMLTNATRKTSGTADSSNPKTGDAIFMTITVMGLSAAALTGLYFYDKKRKVL